MTSLSPGKLTLAGVGGVLLWSAVTNSSISKAFRNIIAGKAPVKGTGSNPIVDESGSGDTSGIGSGGTPGTDSAIANIALSIGPGHAYLYGGAPGTDGSRPWDCSSFANYCIGRAAGLAIPGYKAERYTGAVHGPPTGAWLIWAGVASIPRAKVTAGDIMVWQTHMGIAISNTQMISAQDEALGTNVGPIEGPDGEILFPKRLKYSGSGIGARSA